MNWKKTARRSAVIVTILVLSIVCALIYQVVWDKIDRRMYPRPYSEYVSEYSAAYGVPEYVVYAVIKVESDLDEYIQVREVQTVPVHYAFSECLPDDKDVISKKAGLYPDLLVPLREMGFSLLSEQWKAFYITVTATNSVIYRR